MLETVQICMDIGSMANFVYCHNIIELIVSSDLSLFYRKMSRIPLTDTTVLTGKSPQTDLTLRSPNSARVDMFLQA